MAVLRVHKTKDYTVMSNAHFREKEMSLKAKGLLSLMLSLPDEWDYSIAGLVAICRENETAVRSTLAELEKFGYLRRTRKQDEKGRFVYDYDIYEYPVTEEPSEEKPSTENPHTENPYADNQAQVNTKESSTKEVSTNISNTKDKTLESEFEELWKIYPNKKGKPKALKSYKKARHNGITYEHIESGIQAYKAYIGREKIDLKYVKHGSTFFNNECWNDDYGATTGKATEQTVKPENGGFNIDDVKL